MLEKIDLKKKANWSDYDERIDKLEIRIGELQREAKELGIPVMILFEGYEASGKGTMINRMIRALDPRGFQVFPTEKVTEDEEMHPYLWRFFTKTPAKGRIHIFDKSWYQGYFSEDLTPEDIRQFEKQFTDDGNLIVKFFLAITEKEQKKRLKSLEKNKSTKWRVSDDDWDQNKRFREKEQAYDNLLIKTDTPNCPWTIVEAMDRKYAAMKILSTLAKSLEEAVAATKAKAAARESAKKVVAEKQGEISNSAVSMAVGDNDGSSADKKSAGINEDFKNGVLAGIDLSKSLDDDEYRRKKKDLQKRLAILHNKMYLKRVPVVLAFEGWDAGGKGGAIKRITQAIDPRGYEVVPTASPNDIEKAHHYLWRFWERFPKDGHMAIFDRTWYGRVMVERIEGFATEEEWKRAYAEINNMEAQLVKNGTVVLKFWMHIDKDEQAARFKSRQETPEKQWKITDEDWRNREKWDEYEKAVDEMIVRTSTEKAPWHVIEANDKRYARIKVLEIVVEALENALR
ncbi:MAG: phosphate--AMP phosphotransferase [Eubacterium sp.]|nr:phosphate--AMP phosphotransferase [Eubacterium sp.]